MNTALVRILTTLQLESLVLYLFALFAAKRKPQMCPSLPVSSESFHKVRQIPIADNI